MSARGQNEERGGEKTHVDFDAAALAAVPFAGLGVLAGALRAFFC